jgi:transposase
MSSNCFFKVLLSKLGDPLVLLKRYINFDEFGDMLRKELGRGEKKTGKPAYDAVFMFKILVLQRLYNISDEQIEYQINDRQSFQRFGSSQNLVATEYREQIKFATKEEDSRSVISKGAEASGRCFYALYF